MKRRHRDAKTADGPAGWGVATDQGRVRTDNQDAFFADPRRGVFIVADGIGGRPGGKVAAKAVVRVLPRLLNAYLPATDVALPDHLREMLAAVIVDAGRYLRQKAAEEPGLAGMGTTLVMALFRRDRAYVMNMGDSRAYLLRNSNLSLQSEEHSLRGLLLRNGYIQRSELREHPMKGPLTRYVGMPENVYPYVGAIRLHARDRLLLCTDGLTDAVEEDSITGILCAHDDPDQACIALVDAANRAGGPDNITVLVVDWHGRSQDTARYGHSEPDG